jgi:MFS family permease
VEERQSKTTRQEAQAMTTAAKDTGIGRRQHSMSDAGSTEAQMKATIGSEDAAVAGNRLGYALTAGVLVTVMLGGTLPIPLYVLYEPKMGFGPLGITVVFAVYVIGTLGALLGFGHLSDHFGRKKVLVAGISCAAISTIIFLSATNIGELIAARLISGAAAGFVTGTATAALAELQPRRNLQSAAVLAVGANLVGLGLGPLVAGAFAQYLPAPTRTVFWAYLGLSAAAMVALVAIPETVSRPDRRFRLRLQVEIPTDMRLVMLGAMLGVFGAFTVAGLFSSLVPSFLRGILGVHNLAVIGAASFLLFATAAVTQAVSASLPSRRSEGLGLPLLLAGIGALEGSLFAAALWLFLVGTVVSGVAYGLVFRGGLSEIGRLADPAHRAQVMSAFFVAAYLGLGLPVVLIGLISQLIGTVDASAYVAGLLAVVIVAATVVVMRTFGQAPPRDHQIEDARQAQQTNARTFSGAR